MKKIKLAPGVEAVLLKRKIAKLESDLAYLEQFRHEDLMRVYKAAMRSYRKWVRGGEPNSSELLSACARAAKINTGRGGRGK